MENKAIELIAKAKAAKSAEELFEVAKANGVELTEVEAQTYFEQLHTNAAVSDDELEAVAGGGICDLFVEFFRLRIGFDEKIDCPHCGEAPDNAVFNSSMKPPSFETLPYDSSANNKIEYL